MRHEKGYIALITVILVASLVVVIGLSTSLLSINDLQSSFAGRMNEESVNVTESCIEDILLKLNKNGSLPSSYAIPEGTCTITSNSQVGNTWDFNVSSGVEYKKTIRIVASRTSNVTVTNWLEQ